MQVSLEKPLVQLYRVVVAGVVVIVAGCSSVSQRQSPPSSASVIVPPELATACPITQSAIESLVVKTSGLAYSGARFGNVGTYTYLLAEATGAVNANDKCAPTIVDLRNAADGGTGMVKYSFDVVILPPSDSTKGNGTLLYEVVNRGRTIAIAALQDSNTMAIYSAVKPVLPRDATCAVSGWAAA